MPLSRTPVLLKPGVRVVQRDPRSWQIGLRPLGRILVSASPPVDDFLGALATGPVAPAATPDVQHLCAALERHDLLVEAGTMSAWTPDTRSSGRAYAAVVATHGPAAPAAWEQRTRTAVQVDAEGPDLGALRSLLEPAGVDVRAAAEPASPASVALVAQVGEIRRGGLDGWIRIGTPHLVVRAVDGEILVGPFVVPGATACLRCVDAHRAEEDPRHQLVIEQYAASSATLRRDGVPDPVDPTLWALALATAAHDVLRFLDGARPHTWSLTRTLSPTAESSDTLWRRHPHCGCSWAEEVAV